jgi:uncharacterized protein YjiK
MAKYLILIFCLNITSCNNSADKKSPSVESGSKKICGYYISDPDERMILPVVLHEISGISVIDSVSVACIQDEDGIVFYYDVSKKEISKQIAFNGKGDFEGITKADDTIYALRSDGVLYEIKNLTSSGPAKEIHLKNLPYKNNEGLCYDQKDHRLLIAPKDKPKKDFELKVKHGIYAFDLTRGEFIDEPVISFSLSAIKKFAYDNKIFAPTKSGKKNRDSEPDIKFRPSGISIHPLTGKLFLLSGMEQMLFVFNINGDIENIIQLNPKIYNQPEGITFFKNGDMLISNEGQKGNATLLRLNYNPE